MTASGAKRTFNGSLSLLVTRKVSRIDIIAVKDAAPVGTYFNELIQGG